MKGARILIVEDEAIVACDFQARLTAHGYKVAAVAPSGERTLELMDSYRPEW